MKQRQLPNTTSAVPIAQVANEVPVSLFAASGLALLIIGLLLSLVNTGVPPA